MNRNRTSRSLTYRRLMHRYTRLEPGFLEERWSLLMAAHVVGQSELRLHLHSHWTMLALAVRSRDVREVAGQLLRLALVPVGHLAGRLPVGNVGRATVSAFAPMRPDATLRRLIAQARRGD